MNILEVLRKEHKICICCMEDHDVSTVKCREKITLKGVPVEYDATYEYCDNAETFWSTEEMMTANHEAMIAAYEIATKE